MNSKKNLIELHKICKTFSEQHSKSKIFENLDFFIKPGETVSVCGASGSGKTTFLNIVTMIESPDSGDVIWSEENVTKKSKDDQAGMRGKMFGYIFQGCNLIPELTAIENILFPLRICGKITNSKKKLAADLLSHIGMLNKKSQPINFMSGGEKQRIAIVRAMINEPKILIADEPTGNLDEKNSDSVMEIILDLCAKQSSSLLLITHNEKIANSLSCRYNIQDKKLQTVFQNTVI